jgi:hypothetical protein
MTFITDECVVIHANKLLEAFDRLHQIRPLLDYVDKGTPDTIWIPKLASWDPKPAVICGDARILRNKVERQVLKEAGLMWVCLADGWLNLKWDVYAWKLIKAWPEMRNSITRAVRPTVFVVSAQTLKVEKSFQL